MQNSTPRKKNRKKIIVGFVIVLVFLVGLELLLRHYFAPTPAYFRPSEYPILRYDLKPGTYLTEGLFFNFIKPVLVRINAEGCRSDDYGDDRLDEKTKRLLFVGDSFTFGTGVPDDRVFTSLLETKLATSPMASRVNVINCGVEGYDIEQEARWTEILSPKINPDYVFVVIYENDLQIPLEEDFRRSWLVREGMRHLRIFRAAVLVYKTLVTHGANMQPPFLSQERVVASLDRFRRLAKERNVDVVFLIAARPIHPTINFMCLLDEAGFEWYLAPDLFGEQYLGKIHWNTAGHAAFARWATSRVQEVLGIPRQPNESGAGSNSARRSINGT